MVEEMPDVEEQEMRAVAIHDQPCPVAPE